MINHYQKLTAYNLWANKRLGKIILNVDDALLTKEVKSSFPTLRETILHIWDAETIWLWRLKGESLEEWPGKNFDGGKEDLVMQWLYRSQELNDLVSQMGEPFFSRICHYKTLKGDAFETLTVDIISHIVNHSSYHRGQLVTMLREVGVEQLINTDYIVFTRSEEFVI